MNDSKKEPLIVTRQNPKVSKTMTQSCIALKVDFLPHNRGQILYLLGHLKPGPFEAEDGAPVERGCDLQHGVVVVKASADVRHGHPFLYHCNPHVNVIPVKDL